MATKTKKSAKKKSPVKAKCALCGKPVVKEQFGNSWSSYGGRNRNWVTLYLRKGGQWLSCAAKACAKCFADAKQRPTPMRCVTCNRPCSTTVEAHRTKGHYVVRG